MRRFATGNRGSTARPVRRALVRVLDKVPETMLRGADLKGWRRCRLAISWDLRSKIRKVPQLLDSKHIE